MTSLTQLFVIAALLAATLSLVSIWTPRRLAIKGTALATSILFLPLAYASLVELLSKPKPVDLEWVLSGTTEAEVVASRLVENQGIYVWLQLPDVFEPRAYVLPWDRRNAEQLQQAMREAEQRGNGVAMRVPFEASLDDRERKFYARPQPALPPKTRPEDPPQLYQPPDRDARAAAGHETPGTGSTLYVNTYSSRRR
jgi:hypothetical protein